VFAIAGWNSELAPGEGADRGPGELRRSSWHTRADSAETGQYELSASAPGATLSCRLYGDPARITRGPIASGDCSVVAFPENSFGLGLGAIGGSFGECHERLGELVGVAGCIAYFPSDGAQKADYLVGGGRAGGAAPRAVLASGFVCDGGFSQLIRFSMQPDAEAIALSELAAVGLEAAGGRAAGLVIAGETAGLCGVRLRRSPGHDSAPMRFEVPAVRDWLLFSPERIHPMTTTVIAGVVARAPEGPLAAHLRPLGETGRLFGHFHAAVFSYHPLPQRTVDLSTLLRNLFVNHQLRDIMHLIWDDRGDEAVSESALVRGVAWAGPIGAARRGGE
jgi:hypothetical protein